jgi:hypothetical protein
VRQVRKQATGLIPARKSHFLTVEYFIKKLPL